MVWTARDRAVPVARHGNDVVLASGAAVLRRRAGRPRPGAAGQRHMATLEQVYDYGVTPAGLSPREAAHVLGGQANLWTERIAGPERLFAMALPRELALAEMLWTPREGKDWGSFVARLPAQFAWLEAHGYGFRIPNASFALSGGPAVFEALPGRAQAVAAWTRAPALTVALSVPLDGAVIRYARGGAAPTRRRRPTQGRSPSAGARRSCCGRQRSCTAGPARSARSCSGALHPRRCARTGTPRRRARAGLALGRAAGFLDRGQGGDPQLHLVDHDLGEPLSTPAWRGEQY